MTTQESFKKRVRERMARTGERYGAARRVLLEQADRRRGAEGPGRRWVSEPETAEDSVRDATGHGYDHWVELIEAWPGSADGHTAVAAWLAAEHDVDAWWAQAVTVGWERITGRRLPHQVADGTFTASRSRTLDLDAAQLRALLLDDEARADLFGGLATTLRSRPTAKVLRLGVGPGVAQVAIAERPGGRATVTIAHQQLPTAQDVAQSKAFWGEWLDALEAAVG